MKLGVPPLVDHTLLRRYGSRCHESPLETENGTNLDKTTGALDVSLTQSGEKRTLTVRGDGKSEKIKRNKGRK